MAFLSGRRSEVDKVKLIFVQYKSMLLEKMYKVNTVRLIFIESNEKMLVTRSNNDFSFHENWVLCLFLKCPAYAGMGISNANNPAHTFTNSAYSFPISFIFSSFFQSLKSLSLNI